MAVVDVAKSKEFFSALGFEFFDRFTSEELACLMVGPNIRAMLNKREKFAAFAQKNIADSKTNEVIISLECESIEVVNRICQKALDCGARRINEPEDAGFMYSWGFEDLDGHLWDLFWMKPE